MTMRFMRNMKNDTNDRNGKSKDDIMIVIVVEIGILRLLITRTIMAVMTAMMRTAIMIAKVTRITSTIVIEVTC